MGWTRDLWNINYPSLTTPTPFKSQKIFCKTEYWVQIYFNQKEIKYISPTLPSYTIYSNSLPLPSLTFYGPPPWASRVSAIHVFLVYIIQWNHCSKQYTGETKRRLKDGFNEHRRPVDNPSSISKPTTVSEHFLTNDHSANDITLLPLELIKSNRDSVRKPREAYLIERGKTLEPLGTNKKDEM